MGDSAGPVDAGPVRPGPVEVVGFDRTTAGFEQLDQLVALAAETLAGEGIGVGRLDLVAVDSDEMAELNETHMGHDGPTDVLSFPLDADEVLDGGRSTSPELHLGDVVLCPEVARRQAPGHCGTEEAELALLTIHGVLHILGHDHAEPAETERMQARERAHLASLGHRHPGAPAPQGERC